MRTALLGLVLLPFFALGCSGAAVSTDPSARKGGAGAESTGDDVNRDVGAPGAPDRAPTVPDMDGPVDNSDPGAVELTADRCLGTGCEPVALPKQPELALLDDMGAGWQRLMEADWALAPVTEGYRCMTLTVPEDIYIAEFFPQSPAGTHHSTFGINDQATGPDRVVACGVGAQGDRKLHGAGAGSESIALPDGVAMRLHKGEQVFMNLHLFNPSDDGLTGRSGMWVKTIPAAQVVQEAEAVLAGPLQLMVPAGRSTQSGFCTLRAGATLYGVGPHMHQLGAHIRVTATSTAGDIDIYEGAYDFSHQVFHRVDPVVLGAGDRINVECTYENDTGRTVRWGDSSLDEMCFASLGLYPAIGYGNLPCFN